LSASPTPGNVPHHTTVSRGVRETCTTADLDHYFNMLRCGPSLLPFVRGAAFGCEAGYSAERLCENSTRSEITRIFFPCLLVWKSPTQERRYITAY
jgi:hypothetical protein